MPNTNIIVAAIIVGEHIQFVIVHLSPLIPYSAAIAFPPY